MNILLSGNVTALVTTLSRDLARDKNKVVIAGKHLEILFGNNESKLILHSISPSDSSFSDILSSYKFDIVIYFATREEQLSFESQAEAGQLLDGLKNVLEMSRVGSVSKFFFVSSTEIYGEMVDVEEFSDPTPASLNGYTILAGEKYCEYYSSNYDLDTIVVRVPFVYGAQEKNTFIYDLIVKSQEQNSVFINSKADNRINFVHSADFSQFIRLAINETFEDHHTRVNLSSNEDTTFLELSQLLQSNFPEVNFGFAEENDLYTRPAEVGIARKKLGWVDTHKLNDELPTLIEEVLKPFTKEETGWRRIVSGYLNYRQIIKWFELGLGAILMHLLSELTGTLIQFKYVDFRLLFVVLMGTVYGMRFGLYAAILASFSIIYKWFQLGLDWELLTQNVGNWIPFVIYFSAGIIIGFVRDRKETELEYEKKQTKLIYNKYTFLYNVFNEIRNLKDDFREQLVGYRDSFGRVFKVSQELDTLQEEAVFLKALSILEDIFENESVAIFSMSDNSKFARLEVSSSALQNKLSKSFNLEDYQELIEAIRSGDIFQNKTLLPDYPAYVAPIMNGKKPVALIVLWNVQFDDFSENFFNLFKVISGLFQASLVRASLFLNANIENMFLPSTRILQPEAFYKALQIKEEMRRNKISDYQLIRIHCSGKSFEDLDAQIANKIREADKIGIDEDEKCYIILSQADPATESRIIERLGGYIEKYELVNPREFLSGINQK